MLTSRRPDAVLNPQFFAEDGSVWYQQAYNSGGLQVLLVPYAGYIQLLPRLVAAAAQLFPIQYAPWIFAVVALGVQVAPLVFLFSGRLGPEIEGRAAAVIVAFAYVALPNSGETFGTLTNAFWYLGLLACLVVIADPPRSFAGRLLDVAVVTLTGLSSPFAFVLAPVAALTAWRFRDRHHMLLLGLCLLTAGVQLPSVLGPQRIRQPLNPSLSRLVRIVGGQVFIAGTIGARGYERVVAGSLWLKPWLAAGTAAVGLGLMGAAGRVATRRLRAFFLFAGLALAAALANPSAGSDWSRLGLPNVGGRYYFFATLAWLCALLWLVFRQRRLLLRAPAAALAALVLLVGVPADWEYPAHPDLHFASYAARVERAPRGAAIVIPINPPGWSFVLRKR